jgi:hypothetical protein
MQSKEAGKRDETVFILGSARIGGNTEILLDLALARERHGNTQK